MSYMTGDYSSMAEAVGEVEPRPLSFIPGEDFDPNDPDDVESVKLAMDSNMQETSSALRRENARLRSLLATYQDNNDEDYGF